MIGALLLLATAGSTMDDGWPPPRYRRDTWAHVLFVAPKRITTFCDDVPNPPGWETEACQEGFTVWMPNPCLFDEEYARILCHEIGHVNGWSNNHPGSRIRK